MRILQSLTPNEPEPSRRPLCPHHRRHPSAQGIPGASQALTLRNSPQPSSPASAAPQPVAPRQPAPPETPPTPSPPPRHPQTVAEIIDASKTTSLRLNHIAVLWALDRDRDGVFSSADVRSFFSEVLPQTAQCRDDEFQARRTAESVRLALASRCVCVGRRLLSKRSLENGCRLISCWT